MPALSIITPFWNTSPTLFEPCARSILGSDFTDFEWIVIDDGSDADSSRTLRGILDSDERARLIETDHVGVSAARNAGLEVASGTFVTFVDSDDIVAPAFFGHAVSRLADADADMAIGIVERRYPDGHTVCPRGLKEFAATGRDAIDSFVRVAIAGENLADGDNLKEYGMYTVAPKLYRRSTIEGLRFNEKMSLGEDSLFNAEAASRSRRILAVPEVWYSYVVNDGSSFHGVRSRQTMLELLQGFAVYADVGMSHRWLETDIAMRFVHSLLTFALSLARDGRRGELLALCRQAMSLEPARLLPALRPEHYRMSAWMRLVAHAARGRRPRTFAALVRLRSLLR